VNKNVCCLPHQCNLNKNLFKAARTTHFEIGRKEADYSVGSLGSVNTTESDPTISCEEGDCHDAGSVQSLSAANGGPGKSGRKQVREADCSMGSFGSRSATGNGSIIPSARLSSQR
jgi:hypothetical protein